MNYSLPIITAALVVAGFVSLAAPQTAKAPAVGVPGQALVAEAARRLAELPAVAAKLRQRATLFDQYLVGSGTYEQMRCEGRTLVRLEMRSDVWDGHGGDLRVPGAGRLTSLQLISDGITLWIRRDEEGQKTVSYVNLRRVQEALRAASDTRAAFESPPPLALVGLPLLLQGLADNFVFGEAAPGMLANVPVWIVRGQWKPEKLAVQAAPPGTSRLSDGSLTGEGPNSHVPDTVTLALGRDAFIPLFPYRIEYGRHAGERGHSASASRAHAADSTRDRKRVMFPFARRSEGAIWPLVTIELFEVRRSGAMDERRFTYPLGDQEVEDRTEAYLKRLGLGNGTGSRRLR
mgnify:CR=1 FL=1